MPLWGVTQDKLWRIRLVSCITSTEGIMLGELRSLDARKIRLNRCHLATGRMLTTVLGDCIADDDIVMAAPWISDLYVNY